MKRLKKPYYFKFITQEQKRFDDRNTGFSRGTKEGDKYALITRNALKYMEEKISGKTILDRAMVAAFRTVDYALRKTEHAREGSHTQNTTYRLKNPNPEALTRIVKDAARWIGADLVRVAKVNPLWIYSHWGIYNVLFTNAAEEGDPIEIPADYKNVIVMIHEMNYDLLKKTPDQEPATTMAYSKMAWCATTLASFIREIGYKAIPCGNELGISIPMAVDAGLGEMGRNGLLITREFGPRVRISKVFTDMPLLPDYPIDIGVQKFCEQCGRCAESCPSGAILSGDRIDKGQDISNSEGMLKWPVNAMKCLDWWGKNGMACAVCIRVCPWNKRNNLLHKSIRILAENNILTNFIVHMDKRLGYGKKRKDTGYNTIQDPSVIRKS
jgi:epoxyqueuosine reductase